ncbi:hypothetical protein KHP60_10015 [Microvirga sp. 3-52]|jgi:hypothetical protein|uniref:hypothetical protein n=1 Tax=Microvirga sp. 3-52 TaxID=2792425 RepID=UPI001AD29D60|nr:hypothetical protein [Microvirga sp. 3-52]MBO1905606.1 hypothetical protein [Microvirga sp. 3-52]MBS7452668.1 hypothetical protein [Microvirga sp. 3-52]
MKRVLVLSTILAAGLGTAALAQNPEVLKQQAPNMPAPNQMPAEKVEPDSNLSGPNGPSETGSTNTLSDKLEQSDGVIRPPANASPDITVPAPVPDPGTTPVIRPPGSPGGNQQLDPK